jgi:AcrR family transcriptional regulator
MTNSATSPKRQYDAQASRAALLSAAAELFDARGYERATIREIGERAGVDPALIARYFGGKEGLYLAAVSGPPVAGSTNAWQSGDASAAVRETLERWDARGSNPIRGALVASELNPDLRDQITEILQRHLIAPLAGALERRGLPDAELRAEIALAVAAGVTVTRTNGVLPALADADIDDVLALVEPMLRALDAAA